MSISFHRSSITLKKEKAMIFIRGLHNKPQGCGASAASAAGPFTTNKNSRTANAMQAKFQVMNCAEYLKLQVKVKFCSVQWQTWYGNVGKMVLSKEIVL
jgi:hypothetical protein